MLNFFLSHWRFSPFNGYGDDYQTVICQHTFRISVASSQSSSSVLTPVFLTMTTLEPGLSAMLFLIDDMKYTRQIFSSSLINYTHHYNGTFPSSDLNISSMKVCCLPFRFWISTDNAQFHGTTTLRYYAKGYDKSRETAARYVVSCVMSCDLRCWCTCP